jgi:uncharacterized protein
VDLNKQPILESLTPFTRLLFSLLLIISCFAFTFLIGLLLAGPLFGTGVKDMISSLSDFDNPHSLMLLKYFQVLQSAGLFIIPVLLAGYFFERSGIRYIHLDKPGRGNLYPVSFLMMFAALPFINWMVTMNEMMTLPGFMNDLEEWMKTSEDQATRLTEAFMKMPSAGTFLFNMVMIALLPAIGEEFLFRGLLQRLLKEWLGNIHLAIFISAFLFSALHMQFYGFIPRMVLGIMFGYLFYWSGSLWVPIWAHFINNGAAVIVAYLTQRGLIDVAYENFGATDNVYLIVLSILVTGGCLFLVYKLRSGTDRTPGQYDDEPGSAL